LHCGKIITVNKELKEIATLNVRDHAKRNTKDNGSILSSSDETRPDSPRS